MGPNLGTPAECRFCHRDRFAFAQTIALGAYDGELKSAITRGKDAPAEPLLGELGRVLYSFRRDLLNELKLDLIVPIPQHWTSRMLRSHNPAEILAARIAGLLEVPLEIRVLRKKRMTPRQSSLLPSQRRANLKGAFVAKRKGKIMGRRILLVDDVLTTGATANECAKALKQAGADEIFVAVTSRGLG